MSELNDAVTVEQQENFVELIVEGLRGNLDFEDGMSQLREVLNAKTSQEEIETIFDYFKDDIGDANFKDFALSKVFGVYDDEDERTISYYKDEMLDFLSNPYFKGHRLASIVCLSVWTDLFDRELIFAIINEYHDEWTKPEETSEQHFEVLMVIMSWISFDSIDIDANNEDAQEFLTFIEEHWQSTFCLAKSKAIPFPDFCEYMGTQELKVVKETFESIELGYFEEWYLYNAYLSYFNIYLKSCPKLDDLLLVQLCQDGAITEEHFKKHEVDWQYVSSYLKSFSPLFILDCFLCSLEEYHKAITLGESEKKILNTIVHAASMSGETIPPELGERVKSIFG